MGTGRKKYRGYKRKALQFHKKVLEYMLKVHNDIESRTYPNKDIEINISVKLPTLIKSVTCEAYFDFSELKCNQ